MTGNRERETRSNKELACGAGQEGTDKKKAGSQSEVGFGHTLASIGDAAWVPTLDLPGIS
jgi:hypothetical protein